MAYTVEGAFKQFHDNINLTGDHREKSNARKDDVVAHLKKEFTVLDAFATGSIPRYTALKKACDLDVIVVLHWGKHIKNQSPEEVLQKVRDSLADYKTNVRKNGQAVTLHYKTWPNVDIVPVSRRTNDKDEVLYYSVPNMNTGKWIESRPRKHSSAIDESAGTCGANFRKIIKMIKSWNRSHSEYLQSFHIEAMALSIFSSDLDDTPWQVFQFFEEARKLFDHPFYYDDNVIDDYLSILDRLEVMKRLETARDKARDAWMALYSDKDDESAIEGWKQVFGDDFPSYG